MNEQQDPRIDAYIDQAAPFAQPILVHLRELIHRGCPDVTETIKWGVPAYECMGILALTAAMKQHAIFSLWKGELIPEVKALYGERADDAMGTFGKITKLSDLPDDQKIIDWIRQATDLNERKVKLPQRSRTEPKPEVDTPDDLLAALEQNEAARLTYEAFSPSKKREYVDWLNEAKTTATRDKRLAEAIEWMADGKSRMWKYRK